VNCRNAANWESRFTDSFVRDLPDTVGQSTRVIQSNGNDRKQTELKT